MRPAPQQEHPVSGKAFPQQSPSIARAGRDRCGGDHLGATEVLATEPGAVIPAYRAATGPGVRVAFVTPTDRIDQPVFRMEAAKGTAQRAR